MKVYYPQTLYIKALPITQSDPAFNFGQAAEGAQEHKELQQTDTFTLNDDDEGGIVSQ